MLANILQLPGGSHGFSAGRDATALRQAGRPPLRQNIAGQAAEKGAGIFNTDATAAEIIHQRCPFHLVPVAWVSGHDQMDMLGHWTFVELKARAGLLLALWLLSASFLIWRHLRRRKQPERG
jgi:hypothetical protein